MGISYLHFKKLLFNFLGGIFVFCLISGLVSASIPTSGNETDLLALLELKKHITQDPLEIMSSWNVSTHFCNWVGVACSSSTGRVTALNIPDKLLGGFIPPSIGNLTFLREINLGANNFHGEIPQNVGRLHNLQLLNLSSNFFGGRIPTNLTYCTQLRELDVGSNYLVGHIPDQLSSLSKLVILGLGVNNLTGGIPTWIGNFSSLERISLARNNLQGFIPNEMGRLSGLKFLQLYGNHLSGSIPSSIYNISSIYYFSVAQNNLHGHLPPDIGLSLPNLEVFYCGLNSFTGTIPVSLSNASRLRQLDLSVNGFTGSVPVYLGSFQSMVRLNLEDNRLGTGQPGDLEFLIFLANCTSLEVLGLDINHFGGELPNSVANLTTKLTFLHFGGNLIHGSIPIGIGNLVNLTFLDFEDNYLSGRIPDVIGRLQNLQVLYFRVNNFSGPIPSSLGNLTKLIALYMEENELEGSIPPHLGNCHNLQFLNLSKNNLNGTIPEEVLRISSLSISLDMSHNSLTGSLPSDIGKLTNLMGFDVSHNKLSGAIPITLGSCVSLQSLRLADNTFEGTIPRAMENLRGLQDLDLSHNNFSGLIPDFLSKLMFLMHLNLSYNDFEGEVSTERIFRNASAISVVGNNKLCGGAPELLLPPCSKKTPRKLQNLKVLIPSISASLFVILFLCFAVFWLLKRSKAHSAASSPKDMHFCISYSEVVKSTNGFCEENLIGYGSFGSVYKGVLSSDETVVAIKVLNLQQQGASKSFVHECNALKSIRHRNLLSVITACSTIDHQGNDFKCIVFEFMHNENLDKWLHPGVADQSQIKTLSFAQRLNIAIDVASALDYLHHHCETPIVHCDLKPSNVLLDEDMTAHVGDFGLARFLFDADNCSSENQMITSGLKGSVGYIPPECGIGGQVSVLGDVYSFGILLLEMFTGKRPTDDIFDGDWSIQNFTYVALAEHPLSVIDPLMSFEEEEEDANLRHSDYTRKQKQECLISVLRIGLSCSAPSRSERMSMNVVVNKLHEVKAMFMKTEAENRRRRRRIR